MIAACPVCDGTGRMQQRDPVQPWEWAVTAACPLCAGSGAVAASAPGEGDAGLAVLIQVVAALVVLTVLAQLWLWGTR